MGSKRQYCKYIVPIINQYIKDNNITKFYDLFVGGANLCDKIECENVYANDLSPTLIALHKQAQKDFSKIPEDGSREYWDKAYNDWKNYKATGFLHERGLSMPLYEIGAIEWYSSYARGGFPRGYAKTTSTRNYFKEGRKAHKTQAETEKYQKIIFTCDDYKNITISENALIYCNPPYRDTKPYGISPNFDYNEFYHWLKNKSETNPIFVSEQTLPNEFDEYIIWDKDVVRSVKRTEFTKGKETLWLIDRRKING